jgi:hypothetical protein
MKEHDGMKKGRKYLSQNTMIWFITLPITEDGLIGRMQRCLGKSGMIPGYFPRTGGTYDVRVNQGVAYFTIIEHASAQNTWSDPWRSLHRLPTPEMQKSRELAVPGVVEVGMAREMIRKRRKKIDKNFPVFFTAGKCYNSSVRDVRDVCCNFSWWCRAGGVTITVDRETVPHENDNPMCWSRKTGSVNPW